MFNLYAHNPSEYSFPAGALNNPKDQRTALVISAVVALTYLADRTGLWLKEQKTWSPLTFASLCLAALAVGLVTLKRGGKDLGVLNREQTDEWKGWMQGLFFPAFSLHSMADHIFPVVILIYHYTAASKISESTIQFEFSWRHMSL